jgi:hypothetical protein
MQDSLLEILGQKLGEKANQDFLLSSGLPGNPSMKFSGESWRPQVAACTCLVLSGPRQGQKEIQDYLLSAYYGLPTDSCLLCAVFTFSSQL